MTTPSPTVAASPAAEDVFGEFVAAIAAGDAESAAQLLAEDATIYGRNVGSVGVDAAIADFLCAAEITAVESSEGDSAVVDLEFTGPAPLAARPDCPTGPAGRHSVTIRDGQIVRLDEAGP